MDPEIIKGRAGGRRNSVAKEYNWEYLIIIAQYKFMLVHIYQWVDLIEKYNVQGFLKQNLMNSYSKIRAIYQL